MVKKLSAVQCSQAYGLSVTVSFCGSVTVTFIFVMGMENCEPIN